MGAYLSEPKVDKISTDESNDFLAVGASSMQGWRNSQEDAHNSILNFDRNTSFFAVYDGHGGAEVATYCAEKLPQFLKELPSYKNNKLEEALRDAFLGFDKTLLEPEVVEILKLLAGEKNFAEPDDSDVGEDDEDVEDLTELREEGILPLNEVLEKYKTGGVGVGGAAGAAGGGGDTSSVEKGPIIPHLNKLKEGEPRPSGSKPQSPFLRGRRGAATSGADKLTTAEAAGASSSTSNAVIATSSTTSSKSMETDEIEEDSTVSSSSSSAGKVNAAQSGVGPNPIAACEAEAEPESSDSNKATINGELCSSPDSSVVKDNEQNGVSCSQPIKVVNKPAEGVTSSSSAAAAASKTNDAAVSGSNDILPNKQHNGEICSPSSASSTSCPATTKSIVGSGISSSTNTSRTIKTNITEPLDGDDTSTDSDADFHAEETSSTDESDPRVIEYSSDDEALDDDDDDDDDNEDDDDDEEDDDEDMEGAIANEQFCANMIEEPGKDSGCTAVLALLRGRDLYVANAGDSRCVVCRNGKAIEMSLDHKPEDEEESERILKAGGRVTLDGRVNGGLNLSRAIGDHAYKMNSELKAEEQMISALPDIKKLIISPKDEFMVLACDGIWNFMSSEEVVDFVRLRLKDESKKISQICEELFDNCLAPDTLGDGTGCDNMTAVIIQFKSKTFQLPSTINPKETEDFLLAKQPPRGLLADLALQQALKRYASSPTSENGNEAGNSNKRIKFELKSDNDELDGVASSSSNSNSSSSNCSNTITTPLTDATATTTTTTTTTITKSAECDSRSSATQAEAAAATAQVVSDSTASST